jgi:hypothetical protein
VVGVPKVDVTCAMQMVISVARTEEDLQSYRRIDHTDPLADIQVPLDAHVPVGSLGSLVQLLGTRSLKTP